MVRPENVNRVKVTLDKVPEHVRESVLAAEDASFYTNPGFDISGIGRASTTSSPAVSAAARPSPSST